MLLKFLTFTFDRVENIVGQELRKAAHIRTTLVDNVCYQCLKFKVDGFYSLKVIGKNSNSKCIRVMVLVHCTSP